MVTDYETSSDLRTVSPSVVQDLTNFSGLKFLGVFDPIDGFGRRDCGSGYNPSMPPLVAPSDISVKLFFGLFWLWVATLSPLRNIRLELRLNYLK